MKKDEKIDVSMWRLENAQKVWYEWAVTSPQPQPIMSPAEAPRNPDPGLAADAVCFRSGPRPRVESFGVPLDRGAVGYVRQKVYRNVQRMTLNVFQPLDSFVNTYESR